MPSRTVGPRPQPALSPALGGYVPHPHEVPNPRTDPPPRTEPPTLVPYRFPFFIFPRGGLRGPRAPSHSFIFSPRPQLYLLFPATFCFLYLLFPGHIVCFLNLLFPRATSSLSLFLPPDLFPPLFFSSRL